MLFVFATVSFCTAQTVKTEKKSVDNQVEVQKTKLQEAPDMEKNDTELKKVKEVIINLQEKIDQLKTDLQKQKDELGEDVLTNEKFKKGEKELMQAEEDLQKAKEIFKVAEEEIKKIKMESTELKKDEATKE